MKTADSHLLATLGGTMATGRFLDTTSEQYPTVVLGDVAAQRLGITQPGERIWLGGQWFQVIGVMHSIELAQDIDRSALVGAPVAQQLLGAKTAADSLYLRADVSQVDNVRDVVPATANPANPDQVQVSRPSDALAARAAASNAFTALFLGLGAVALLVGGVGIANVMVISVLERRSEVGLRRALGATRRHVSIQFLMEALLLSFAGGARRRGHRFAGHRRLRAQSGVDRRRLARRDLRRRRRRGASSEQSPVSTRPCGPHVCRPPKR